MRLFPCQNCFLLLVGSWFNVKLEGFIFAQMFYVSSQRVLAQLDHRALLRKYTNCVLLHVSYYINHNLSTFLFSIHSFIQNLLFSTVCWNICILIFSQSEVMFHNHKDPTVQYSMCTYLLSFKEMFTLSSCESCVWHNS
jgi:hypothetical protein